MSAIESAYPSGFYRSPTGSLQSISSAVTSGDVARSTELGKVVLKGLTMTAEAAIGAGMINQASADFVAKLQGTDKPAPFTREDQQRPPEAEQNKTPAQTCVEALGAFFTSPTATSKAVALKALEAHLVASNSIPAKV